MAQLNFNDDFVGVHVATHPIGVDCVIQREIYCFKEKNFAHNILRETSQLTNDFLQ